MSVVPVMWQGICDECGESAPESRDNFAQAQEDAETCPCRYTSDVDDQDWGDDA